MKMEEAGKGWWVQIARVEERVGEKEGQIECGVMFADGSDDH